MNVFPSEVYSNGLPVCGSSGMGTSVMSESDLGGLPPMQVLLLDDNQAPLPDVPVTFTITAGGGSLTITLGTAVPAKDAEQIDVSVSGP